MPFTIDVKEDKWSFNVISNLLIDRSTGENIVWATNDYIDLGIGYNEKNYITIKSITGENNNVIQPRVLKTKSSRTVRTKERAEVYTPSWLCNAQNNLIDNEWFGKKNIFNYSKNKNWKTNKIKIPFDNGKNWKDYITDIRLEVACGEAPYLVSRYDTVSGQSIDICNRIGMLDRKLRVINENTCTFEEWYRWVLKAFKSVYGFEYQGDSLLLARENLLLTYCDYLEKRFDRSASEKELLEISNIISWNVWQMDGISYTVPYQRNNNSIEQLSFFDSLEEKEIVYSVIKNWQNGKIIKFIDLIQGE